MEGLVRLEVAHRAQQSDVFDDPAAFGLRVKRDGVIRSARILEVGEQRVLTVELDILSAPGTDRFRLADVGELRW